MNTSFSRFTFFVATALLFLAAQRPCLAGSATWKQNPSSDDWNTASNWTPQTVPNATTDIASFDTSNVTDVTVDFGSNINVDSVVFGRGAPAYTITVDVSNLKLNGAGFVNNSGSVQSVVIPQDGDLVGAMFFFNSASAGNMTTITSVGGLFTFYNSSTAGSAIFNLTDGAAQAILDFNDTSTAGDATVNASAAAFVAFLDSSSGGNSTLNLSTGATAAFAGSNNAEHMTANCIGGDGKFSSEIDFEGFSSAGDGTFTAVGGSTNGEQGGFILFDSMATADHATFVINGGMGAGLSGTQLLFIDKTTAAHAHITANGGVGGSAGGAVIFEDKSKGGKASITLNGNAELDLSAHNAPGVTIGSLAGEGSVLLGANTLTIGSNNQSTTFSGVIQGSGGVSKSGTGTFTLSGANTYTGATTVEAGALLVTNTKGSATGTGAVQVNGGILGGRSNISGAVTIGSGSGTGASLAPGINGPGMLAIHNLLTFNSDGTYQCDLNTNNSKADQVLCKGVTINGGAQFALQSKGNRTLPSGTVLTVIDNRSRQRINGTFSNLPDNSTISAGNNTFKVSYEGGDGNDLVLTVNE